MKRQREDPNEYLGGDLATSGTVTLGGPEDADDQRKLTKAERNEARKAANKKWKLVDRKVGSGKDPNPRHTVYYKAQLPDLRDETEWARFQEALVDPLPVTFRFGGYCPTQVAQSLQHSMSNEFKTMRGKFVEINGVVLKDNIVRSIAWPGSNVYQISADSPTLARNPGLESLSKLLLREVELGHVVRQELASMIPALMLDVEAHHNVLDVCAAPGSKTEQLLSILRSKCPTDAHTCPGMVVANDADPVRINTLKRRYARCGSPNLLVTCSRAEDLQRTIGRPVFDRIVADVPCSGDGTIRKFPHIWRLFRPRMSLELHMVQLQIAIASVLLLKPGGRMVYSTCSINPLEDEAVVAGLLRRFQGRVRLVDTRAEGLLPGLITRPGQSHWECSEEVFTCGESDESSRKASVARLPKLVRSMRPPSPAEVPLMHLHRCHRVLPQDNNTGGFFVAVLELLPEGAPIDPAFAAFLADTAAAEGKAGKKSKSEEVSAEASMEIMRNLGYNPKHTTHKGGNAAPAQGAKKTPAVTATALADPNESRTEPADGDDAAATKEDGVDVPVVYHALTADEFRTLQGSLHLDSSTVLHQQSTAGKQSPARNYLMKFTHVIPASKDAPVEKVEVKPDNFAGIFGSKATGWVKKVHVPEETVADSSGEKRVTRYSMVSENVRAALSTWASGSPLFLRQAGVAVAEEVRLRDPRTRAMVSAQSALPDAAAVLAPCVEKQLVVPLAPSDFKFLVTYILQTTREDAAEGGLARLLSQAAVIGAPDYDLESVVLEELSLEEAQLQVELATGLSADGLQALREAYLACAGRLSAKKDASVLESIYLVSQHSATAGGKASAGEDGNQTGEKRRLSKAERKKLKQPSAGNTKSAAPTASASGSSDKTAAGNGQYKPQVLLLQLSQQKDQAIGVTLLSGNDVCRSYHDAM